MAEGKVRFSIEVDDKGSITKIEKYEKSIDKLGKTSKKTKEEQDDLFGKALKWGSIIYGAKKAYDLLSGSVDIAADAIEAHSKLNVVFAGQTERVSAVIKDLNDNYGFSSTAAERLMGNTGDLLAGLGFQQDVVFGLSEKVQKLAGDTASFSNVQGGAGFASKALTSMLLGEKEMAKQLGIVINENDKSFRNQVKTLVEVEGMTLVQAQALVRLDEAYKQSKLSIGDFSRTQDSFANQAKILDNTLEDLRVEFGKVFVEVALPILRDFSNWMKDNKDTIVSGFLAMGKAAEFAVGPIRALSLASELIDQNADAMERAGRQAVEFEKSFDDIYAALRGAGVEAKTLNDALADQRGADEVERLTQRQKELNEWIKLGATVMNEFGAEESQMEHATAKLNEVTAEKNRLLSAGIYDIVKTADVYGISAEQIKAMRAELQGEINEKVAKSLADAAATDGQRSLNTALTEAEIIAESYGVSLAAATEIIKAQNPELEKIKSIQERLGVSLQDATVVYNEVNRLEEQRKENLEMMEKPLSENLDLNIDLTESFQGVVDSMDRLDSAQAETAAGFESEYSNAIDSMIEKTAGAPPEMDIMSDAIEMLGKAGKQELFSGFDGVTGIFDSLGVEVPSGAKKVAGGIGDIASGIMSKNPIKVIQGVIGSVSGLIDLFSGDGIQEAMDRENGWMDLSEELSGKLHDLAEEIGDTHAATSLMFSDILSETELTTENFGEYVDRQREILIDMDNGLISHKEAIAEMGSTWKMLVEEAERLNTEGSAEMIETLRNLRSRGEDVADIQDYVNEQLDEGLKSLQNYTQESGDAANEIIKLEKEIGTMKLGSKEFNEASKRLSELQTGFSDISGQEEFNDAISYTMGFMQAFQQDGLSMFDIIERMGPSIENLQNIADVGDFKTGGLTELLGLSEFMGENEKVFQGIEQTKGMLEALGNTAYLTADTFSTMQKETLDYYNELSKDPEDRVKALQAVAPLLAKELWYAEQNNLELDEKTKKLIEAAEKEGVNIKDQIPFQERQTQLMESQLEVMTALAAVFGVHMPSSIENATEALKNFEKEVGNVGQRQKELENMQMGTVGGGGPGATPGMGTTTPAPALNPGIDNKEIPGFAEGTDGWLQVSQPTMIMVGEGGENEFLNVIPQSQLTTQNLSGLTEQIANVDGTPQVSDMIQVGPGASEITNFFSSELPQAMSVTAEAISQIGDAASVADVFANDMPLAVGDSITYLDNIFSSAVPSVVDYFGVSADSMVDAFVSASQESLVAVEAFSELAIKKVSEFDEILTESLNGDLNVNDQQTNNPAEPANDRPKVGFANGTPPGGFRVPGGFPRDTFPIGVTSGEIVHVEKPGQSTGGNNSTINMNVSIINSSSDTPDAVADKLIIALERRGDLRRKITGA